jgi:hypothetical protein
LLGFIWGHVASFISLQVGIRLELGVLGVDFGITGLEAVLSSEEGENLWSWKQAVHVLKVGLARWVEVVK